MSLTPPTRSNAYAVTPDHDQSSDLWNAVLADLHARLLATEAAAAGFETAVSDAALVTAQGYLANAVAPQVDGLQTQMAAITAAIALAEDALQALQSGGIQASNVVLSAIEDFAPTNVQDAVETLIAAMTAGLVAEATARTVAITAETNARNEAITAEATARAAAIAAIPITGEYEFEAASDIVAGKAVLLKDGKVIQSKISAATASAIYPLLPNATATSVCYDPVHDKFLVIYVDASDGDKAKGVVVTVAGGVVGTVGAPFTLYGAAVSTASESNIDSCYDSDTGQIIVAYATGGGGVGRLRACTIVGDTITAGAEYVTAFQAYSIGLCYDPSVSKVLYAYRISDVQWAAVFSVDGTSLALLATTSTGGTGVNGYTASLVHCEGLATPGINVIGFNRNGTVTIRVAKISPVDFQVSFGPEVAPTYSGTASYMKGGRALAWHKEQKRVLSLFAAGGGLSYWLSVSLHSLDEATNTLSQTGVGVVDNSNYGTPYENFPSIVANSATGAVCVVFPDYGSSDYGKASFSTAIGPTAIAWSTPVQFASSNVGWTAADHSGFKRQMLTAFSWEGGVVNLAVLGEPYIDERTNFIGFAKEDALSGETVTVATGFSVDHNQVGLTPGSDYYLSGTDGSTLVASPTHTAKVGRALSATDLLVLGGNVYT